MWVIAAIILLLLTIAEAVFVLSDKLPWNKKKYKKQDRWWEDD